MTITSNVRPDPAVAVKDSPRLFHLVMQVWGQNYCDALTELCLPALLSPGNIPALVADWPARFILYTREKDIPQITASQSYHRLEAIVPVEFKTIDEQLKGSKYLALTKIHHRVLGVAAYEHAAIVWLVGPDRTGRFQCLMLRPQRADLLLRPPASI